MQTHQYRSQTAIGREARVVPEVLPPLLRLEQQAKRVHQVKEAAGAVAVVFL